MERNNVEITVPNTKCCGMPQMANSNFEGAQENFNFNVSLLAQIAEQGYDIVTTCPSSNMMLRKEGLPFFESEEARFVSTHLYDAYEYLLKLHSLGRLNTGFGKLHLRVFYHNPCHLKVQNIQAAITLMQMIPSLEMVGINTDCCGMGGSYGMKKHNYRRSIVIAENVWTKFKATQADLLVTECGGCGLQLRAGTRSIVMHPVTLLNKTYGAHVGVTD